ncbi:putative pre-mRNA splicing factor [Wallemia mellicola]|uniref:RNA helicase n=1 Tax=Wallemia mellicola TaxID=1708541 RepID=A0A4V4MM93_9BASI|nr:putative pre-mRNA splicing factor [Wallemia mellicola]
MAKQKARTVLVRLISTAKTGFFYQCQRPRLSEKLSAMKYDPKVKQHVLFVEGKRISSYLSHLLYLYENHHGSVLETWDDSSSSLDRANEAEGSLAISSLHNSELGQKLLWMLEEYQVTIVVGQTGCGKTTQLPQYLYEEGWATPPYTIACTQPRRVAATSIAQRVAQEVGSVLGDEVGYSIRFEDLSSANRTRIKYLTDGMLFRETLMDPLLSKYSVIMIDEAHERNSYTDVLLGVLKKILKRRPDLRLIISSATLTVQKFVDFFGGSKKCGTISLDGRLFPVEVSYTQEPVSDYVRSAVETVISIHETQGSGDILVFLTGREEIDRALQLLSDNLISSRRNTDSLVGLPLHAGLTSEEQLKIFERPPSGVRKVVFSTNIAEASITIDGIRYVVDSGFVKLRHFNPATGIDILSVAPSSKASLTQRAGRAGRTAPGKTFRLFPESALLKLDESTVPEICRTDLTGFILQLKALGVSNVLRFDYLDNPPSSMLVRALELLYALGALDDSGHLTPQLGLKMAEIPLDPMMTKILLNSVSFECSEEILTIAAMTSVQNPFLTHDGPGELERRKFVAEEGDHLTLLNAYNAFVKIGKSSSRWAGQHRLNFKALSRAVSIRSQLSKYLEKFNLNPRLSAGVDQETIRKCLVSGYFKNVARFNPDGTYTLLNGNQIVNVHPSSVMFTRSPSTKWVVFHEQIVETTKIFIRDLTVINDDWLVDESLTRGFYQSNDSSRNATAQDKNSIQESLQRYL